MRLVVKTAELVSALTAAAHRALRPEIRISGNGRLAVMADGRPVTAEVVGYIPIGFEAPDGSVVSAPVCAQCILCALGTHGRGEVGITVPMDGGPAYFWTEGGLYRVPRGWGNAGHCGGWV